MQHHSVVPLTMTVVLCQVGLCRARSRSVGTVLTFHVAWLSGKHHTWFQTLTAAETSGPICGQTQFATNTQFTQHSDESVHVYRAQSIQLLCRRRTCDHKSTGGYTSWRETNDGSSPITEVETVCWCCFEVATLLQVLSLYANSEPGLKMTNTLMV